MGLRFAAKLVELGWASSKSEANRLLKQGAISINFGERWIKLSEGTELDSPYPEFQIKLANRRFAVIPEFRVDGVACMTIPLADVVVGCVGLNV